jgi:hypothetical protein
MLELPASNNASSAAFSMLADSARVPAAPLENGSNTPTRTGVCPFCILPSFRKFD